MIGALFFGVGYLAASYTKNYTFVVGTRKLSNNGENYHPRYTVLYLLGIICIVAYIYNLYMVISGAGSVDLAIMKAFLQQFTLKKSSWLNAFYFLFVEPLSVAIPVISISNIIYGRKDKKLFTIAIFLIIIKTVTNTTRNTIVIIIVYFIVGTLILIKKNVKNEHIKKFIKKRKKQITLAIIAAVVIFVSMTVARGSKLFENLWVDFALPPRLFEVWKKEIDSNRVYGGGFASLQGFIYPIFYILKNIFNIDMPVNIATVSDLISRTDTEFVWPGQNVTANAYVSTYWFMYLDCRIVGIIIGSFIMGFISSKVFKRMMKNMNERNITIFYFIYNMVVFSIVRIQFTGVAFAMGFIYVFFLYKKSGGMLDENFNNQRVG